jgi:ribose transport system ATP-binding protein
MDAVAAQPADFSGLRVQRLSVTFPGMRALTDVDLHVALGEVHALVGHNGSGKSTLIKVLSGLHAPDKGSAVTIGGRPLPWESPADSERLGVRVVQQNLGLVPVLSITENVLMGSGYSARRLGRIAWRQEHDRVAEHMSRLGYEVDTRSLVGELPAATRSAVAMARALSPRRDRPAPQILLLDEITAAMPEPDIQRVLQLVRTLTAQDVAVLYVSHHLEEVLQVADRVTVLRDGRRITCLPGGELTQDGLAELVIGETQRPDQRQASQAAGVRLGADSEAGTLRVTELCGATVQGLSFSATPGGIVGIAGITGSGREEMAQLLLGALPREGAVELGGQIVPPDRPRRAVEMGMTLVPADRMADAVISSQNVRENLTVAGLRRQKGLAPIQVRAERAQVDGWIEKLAIRGATADGSINTLSGGNQQKVILARCLSVKPKLLVLDEPTQGVDIGAKAEIHSLVREASSASAVVVCSSDNYELASLCTEVLVLHRGRLVGHLFGEAITEQNLDRMQLSPTSLQTTGS